MGRFVRNLALFVVFATATAIVSHHLFPFPANHFVKGRMEFLEAVSPGFDVAFLGSSATLRGVDPVRFDEEVERRCGGRVHSVNLAVRGANGSFIDTLLGEATGRISDSLRWVVFEARAWDEQIEPFAQSDERAIWLHSVTNTTEWVLDVWALSEPISTRFALMKDHLLHMMVRYLRVGQGVAIVRSGFVGPVAIDMPKRGAELLAPGPRLSAGEQERRRRFLADPEGFDRDVARLAASPRDGRELSRREHSRFEDRLAVVREGSLGSLHFLVPNANKRARALRTKSESLRELIPDLVMFDDPVSHPEFFDPSNRWDRVHLNERGAGLLSSKLAAAFCQRFGSEVH